MTLLGYVIAQILVPEVTSPPAVDLLARRPLVQETRTRIVDPRDAFLTKSVNKVADEQRVTPRPIPIGQRRASLNASDWELSQALSALSKQTNVNIVLASKDNPKITVQLREMPLLDILRVLAAVTGLRFVQAGESYVVATEEVLKTSFPLEYALQYPAEDAKAIEPSVVKRFICSHVSASEASQTLAALLPKDSKLQIAVAPAPGIPGMGGGGATGAISGGSSSGGSSAGGTGGGGAGPETGGSATGGASSSGGGGVQVGGASGEGRMLVLRGPEDEVKEALTLLKEIDAKRPQVVISVEIVDVSKELLKEMGLSWSFANTTLTERAPSGIGFETIDRSAFSGTGIIKAVQTDEKSRILARPSLSVLDGQSAYILIGDRINYPVVIGLSDNNTPVFDIKEERVGVYFQVGANVTEEGEIVMNLYPQVSAITGFLQVNGASYPQVSTREAKTVLRVKSGQTIAVGGLIREEDIDLWEKVPLLGDLPILGELFKRKRTTRNGSEVMIFITPIILVDEPGSGAQ